jgi:peptidoglycan/LPS O-acetylase OafA/YrhL
MSEPAFSSSPPGKSRLDALTVLRFGAALWVLGFHLQIRAPIPAEWWWKRAMGNGAYAMTIFFVLSGVVLAYGYHHLRPKAESVLAFYQARFARIYAPYAVLHLVALYWVSPTTPKETSAALYTNVLSALGLQAWSPHAALTGANGGTWSISAEFFFYALFPALLPLLGYLRQRWGTLRTCAYVSALSGFVGLADFAYGGSLTYYTLPIARLPEFMLGVVVGLELLSAPGRFVGNNASLALAVVCAALAAFNPVLDYGLWIRANLVVVPVFAWLIFELARWDQRRPASRNVTWRVLIYLGESSYCLFLAHMIPMLWLDSVAGRNWITQHGPATNAPLWIAIIAASLVGAFLLHELVEKPARRALLRRWQPAKAPAPAA